MDVPPITSFPTEVADKLGYYVYRLVDPRDGATFYIGKGAGQRIFQHNADEDADTLTPDAESEKNIRLREIEAAGMDVIRIVHRHGMDEATAYEVEAALIDAYPECLNQQAGHGSAECGLRSLSELLQAYAAAELKPQHSILLVSISKTRSKRTFYDAARFAWKLNVKRAAKCALVLAHDRGLVVGVFRVESWHPATKEYFSELTEQSSSNRYGFIGSEAAPAITRLYLGKRIPAVYRKRGALTPFRYIKP